MRSIFRFLYRSAANEICSDIKEWIHLQYFIELILLLFLVFCVSISQSKTISKRYETESHSRWEETGEKNAFTHCERCWKYFHTNPRLRRFRIFHYASEHSPLSLQQSNQRRPNMREFLVFCFPILLFKITNDWKYNKKFVEWVSGYLSFDDCSSLYFLYEIL